MLAWFSPQAGNTASYSCWRTFPTAVYVRNVTTIPYSFQFKGYSMVWLPAGPPTAARTCLPPQEGLPSLPKNLRRHRSWNWGVEVKGWGLMSADTPAPSLWDNQASESKLSSVCAAGARRTPLQSWPLPTHSYVFHLFFFSYLKIFSSVQYKHIETKRAEVRLLWSWM